jgi:kynurenine formamidase
MKIIDLSISTENSPSVSTEVEITYLNHEQGADYLCNYFNCDPSDLPDGLGPSVEKVTLISHAGTHVDAPWHYAPTSEGKRSRTIEELPLEWFFSDGVVLDMRHLPNGSTLTIEDIEASLKKIRYSIKPLDIVLIQTGADKYWGKADYFDRGCGLERSSTLWLLDRGVKVIGTDAWGLDRPFWAIRDEFQLTHHKEILWQAHYAGIDKEYCQIEKLANLDKLPRPIGFKVACFPVKIKAASAGWCRSVALVEEWK